MDEPPRKFSGRVNLAQTLLLSMLPVGVDDNVLMVGLCYTRDKPLRRDEITGAKQERVA